MLSKVSKNINVQATIKEPQLYLLARCSSTNQQILYSEERITDLFRMLKPIQFPNGVMINDIARFFKGDSPVYQFDISQRKEEISLVHLVTYIQTMHKKHMLLTYDINDVTVILN